MSFAATAQKASGSFTRKIAGALNRMTRLASRMTLPTFATSPKNLVINPPRRISNPQHICLGDDVKLGPNCVLSANTRYPGGWMHHPEGRHVSQTFQPTLRLGDRVTATSALQIYALDDITIEDDVMFASNVFISDGLHAYHNANEPYKYQGMTRISPIRVGRGSWIGQNVVIVPGVTIGEFVIIGANSVVTKSIPARSIAAGAPAQVTKRWNEDNQSWEAVTNVDAGI